MSVRSQEQSNWGWDATSQSVIWFRTANRPSQCQIANTAFNSTYCCSYPSYCNRTNTSSGMVSVLGRYGVSAYATGALSFTQVQTAINANKPFIMGWYWTSGGGHAIDGYGYNTTGQTMTIWDPWPGRGTMVKTYSSVLRASDHTWSETVACR